MQQPRRQFLALLGWRLFASAAVCAAASLSPHPVVVLIAVDGVPQRYLSGEQAPFLRQLAAAGTTAEWMFNQFPERALSNWQSVATGLYPAVHGILADRTFAADGTYRCIGYGEKMYAQTANVTPIWTLNELSGNGRHSGVIAWPGAEFSYRSRNPTFRIKVTDCASWERRVDDAVKWLTDERTPANLVLAHFEAGPDRGSQPSAPTIMRQLDRVIERYFEQLTEAGIRDAVNTIIISDHTLVNRSSSVGVMPECKKAARTSFQQDDAGCYAEIFDSLQQATILLNTFKGTEYAKLKSNFRNEKISRKAEQYLNAQQDKIFQHPAKLLRTLNQNEDNSGMYPLFIANGPLFKANYIAAPFENTDIYALVSHVLNLTEPVIPINGSLDAIKDVLWVKSEPVYENVIFKVILFFIVGLLLLAFAWYMTGIRRQERLRL